MESGLRKATGSDFKLVVGRSNAGDKIFGMKNPSKANLCYVNSLVQCLLSLRVFPLATLRNVDLHGQPTWKALVDLWATIDDDAFGMGSSLSCGNYLSTLLEGKVGEQQDAHELLLKLVDRLDSEAPRIKKKKKKKKNDWAEVSKTGAKVEVTTLGTETTLGPVMEVFGAVFQNSKKNRRILEPAVGVRVPLLSNWQSWINGMKFEKVPEILILHLEREMDGRGRLVGGEFEGLDTINIMEDTFDLHAVLLHAGDTLYRGHYIARIHMGDHEWSERDDETCSRRVEDAYEKIRPFVPYILFFRKRA